MHTRTGSVLTPSGMVVAKTEQEFIDTMRQGMANWNEFCRTRAQTHAGQLEFLNKQHRHVIFHVGTHGQISVELFDTTTGLAIDNPTRTLDTRNGKEGAIRYPDGPARFERFELPPGVKNFRLHEGAIAPGVCFSDEGVSFKNLMTALTIKNKAGMVKNIDPDPENWSNHDDYEINLSNELIPHKEGFYKHHWKERHYTPQSPLAPKVDRSKYPIVKRFITTINELKKSDIRLFEWHVVAFMMFEGKFFFIDLNPYLFAEEKIRATQRSRVEKRDDTRPKSNVEYRDDINELLHAVTNTAKLVALFSNTTNITCIDSTCSVLRFKVHDGRGINGALSNIRYGSYDGVIDSYDIRLQKLKLKHMLESKGSRLKSTYRDINKLTGEIRSWYSKKDIIVPAPPEQLVVNKDSDPSALTIIRLLLTNINYESIWIRPIEYGKAMECLMAEIGQYMGQVISLEDNQKLMNWLNTYMKSRVRTLTVGQIDRYGFDETESESDEIPSIQSPLASLDKPANASHFTKLESNHPEFFEGGKKTKTRKRHGKRNKSRNFRNKSRVRRTRRRVIKRKNNKK
jgi:hypothetical protein